MGSRSCIPLEEVTALRSSNDHVGFVRMEHGFGDFVLASECHFGFSSETKTVEVYSAIRLVKLPLVALTHTSQEELTMIR